MSGFLKNAKVCYNQKIAIIPVNPKTKIPFVKGYQKIHKNGKKTLKEWGRKFANAQCGLLTRPNEIAVVDIDAKDKKLLGEMLKNFGSTPLVAKTKRGFHLYYTNPKKFKGGRHEKHPVDLKASGGSDYVRLPNDKDVSFVELDGDGQCKKISFEVGLKKIANIPAIKSSAVKKYFPQKNGVYERHTSKGKSLNNVVVEAKENYFRFDSGPDLYEGERNQRLFDTGLQLTIIITDKYGKDEDAFRRLKRQLTKLNKDKCIPPLPQKEVLEISKNIWKYESKNKNYKRTKPRADTIASLKISKKGIRLLRENPKAYALLYTLLSLHKRDFELFLSTDGLAEMLGWSKYIVNEQKKNLIAYGLVKQVSAYIVGNGSQKGVPAKFVFTDKVDKLVKRIEK